MPQNDLEQQVRDNLKLDGKKAERFVREAEALRANLALRRRQKEGQTCKHSK